MAGQGRVVRRTTSMEGKANGAGTKDDKGADVKGSEDAAETPPEGGGSETVEGSAGPAAGAQARGGKGRGRRGNQPASRGSAAAKSRKKKAKPPTQEELAMVGEVVQIAYGAGGKDSIPPAELVESYRKLVAAWDKVHGAA